MNSIVVHYKELALKGKNRPWFIRLLVRNLKGALAGLARGVGAIDDGAHRARARAGRAGRDEVRDRLRRVFGIANFSYANRGPHDFAALAAAILADLGDRDVASFRVSATRSDKRLPFTSPQVEREVGGLIKEAKGWRVDLEHPALTVHIEMLPDGAFYFFGKEPGAGGMPSGSGGTRRVPALGRHRLAGRRLPADAPRLLRAADSLSQLSDPVARVAGEGARDRRAADAAPAALAAAARAVRRAAAAGRARGAAGACASSSIGG